MKARIENGVITVFTQLPLTFKNENVSVIGEFDKLTREELEGYGFFDILEPALPEGKMYGDVIYNDTENTFTYSIIDIPPAPQKITPLTPLEFLNRFTDAEAKTILTLTKSNIDVELWWIKYNKASFINIYDSQTAAGVQSLEDAGIIGPGRAGQILS